MNVVYDATQVELDIHRWSGSVRITRPDSTVVEFFVCAEQGHSGLWIGDPAEHRED